MSSDLPTGDLKQRVQSAQQQLDQRHYREAHAIIKELKEQAATETLPPDIQEAVAALEQQLATATEEAISEARSALDAILSQLIEEAPADAAKQADAYRKQWEDALLGESDITFSSYRSRVKNFITRFNEFQVYKLYRDQVEDEWRQANAYAQANPQVSQNVLLEFYTRALDIARAADAEHPGNNLLESLLERANSERERRSGEEEAVTSGAQLGEYLTTFQYIDQAPADELISVVNDTGQPLGRRPRDEARAFYEEQARRYLDSKFAEYFSDARTQLDIHRPRSAAAELNRFDQFEDLRPLLRGNLLSSDNDGRRQNIRTEIQQHIQSLEEAEEMAETAASIAEQDIAGAWQRYKEALDHYQGAAASPTVQAARQQIAQAAASQLTQADRHAGSLISQSSYRQAQQHCATALAPYEERGKLSNLAREVEVGPALQTLRDRHNEATRYVDAQADIQARLDDIQLDIEAAPNVADEAFKSLRQDYWDMENLLLENERYEEVEAALVARLGASRELESLRENLSSTNMRRVQSAIDRARSAARKDRQYHDEYIELQEQLEAYKTYLEARQQFDARALQTAHDLLASLQGRLSTLPSDLQSQISTLQKQVDERFESTLSNQAALKDAQDELDDGDAQAAYAILERMQYYASPEQERQAQALRQEVKRVWLNEIEDRLSSYSFRQPFDLSELNDLLNALRQLNRDRERYWRKELELCSAAQDARDMSEMGNLDGAVAQWRELHEATTGLDKSYCQKEINRLNKAIVAQEKDSVVQRVQQSVGLLDTESGDGQALDDTLLASLIDMAERLGNLARASNNKEDQRDFVTWQLEVMLRHAEYTPDVAKSRNLLSSADALAREWQSRLGRLPLQDTLRRALEIVEAMHLVALHVTQSERDLGQFVTAVRGWQSLFTDKVSEEFPVWDRWYKQHVRQLINRLRQSLQQPKTGGPMEPQRMLDGAKLRVLNPDDDLGQAASHELDTLTAELDAEIDAFKERLLQSQINAAETIDDPVQLLAAQIKEVEEYLHYTHVISEVSKQSKKADAATDARATPAKTGGQPIGEQSLALETWLKELGQLKIGAERLLSYLRSFQLHDGNWEEFIPAVEGEAYSTAVIDRTTNIAPVILNAIATYWEQTEREFFNPEALKGHSIITRLQRLQLQYQDEMRALAYQVQNVLQHASKEQYTHALRLADDTILQPAPEADDAAVPGAGRVSQLFFDQMRLYKSIKFEDPFTGQTITGWPRIIDWLQQREAMIAILLEWAEPYHITDQDPTAGQPEPDLPVVDWPACLERAQQVKDGGNFQKAIDLVACALDGGNNCDLQGQPLNDAWQIIARPPLASESSRGHIAHATSNDYQEAYRQAMHKAESQRGQRVLERMRQEIAVPLLERKNAAEQTLARFRSDKDIWRAKFQALQDKLGHYQSVDSQGWRPGKGAQLAGLKREIQELVVELSQLSRQHPQLRQLENDPVYQQVRGS